VAEALQAVPAQHAPPEQRVSEPPAQQAWVEQVRSPPRPVQRVRSAPQVP
jgi:hypothetical protein